MFWRISNDEGWEPAMEIHTLSFIENVSSRFKIEFIIGQDRRIWIFLVIEQWSFPTRIWTPQIETVRCRLSLYLSFSCTFLKQKILNVFSRWVILTFSIKYTGLLGDFVHVHDIICGGNDVEDPGVCLCVRTVGDVSDLIEVECLSLYTGSSPPHLVTFSCLSPDLVSLPAATDPATKYILVESLPWSAGANICSVVTLTWDWCHRSQSHLKLQILLSPFNIRSHLFVWLLVSLQRTSSLIIPPPSWINRSFVVSILLIQEQSAWQQQPSQPQ